MAFEEIIMNFATSTYFVPLIIAISIWDLFWKAWALWEAGGRKEKIWFIIILITTTAGILPLIYLWLRKWNKKAEKKRKIIRY